MGPSDFGASRCLHVSFQRNQIVLAQGPLAGAQILMKNAPFDVFKPRLSKKDASQPVNVDCLNESSGDIRGVEIWSFYCFCRIRLQELCDLSKKMRLNL